MTPTQQQKDIIETQLQTGESLLVEAGAGTGKTTCFIEFSKSHPHKKILYLCFNNKSVEEAREKYRKEGIKNTTTSTIHGLARGKKALYESKGKFQTKISLKEIQLHLQCPQPTAWRVQSTLKAFCESADKEPKLEHLPTQIKSDPIEKRKVLSLTKTLWEDMKNPDHSYPISYDHYLKTFEMESPQLAFDYILLDECQDSNPISLSIIEAQKKTSRLVLIGDRHQAIYGWRGAKNAMEEWIPTQRKTLSESFRFGPEIATLANLILAEFQKSPLRLTGHKKTDSIGPIDKSKPYTLIARTNATLFETALEYHEKNKKFHFVGSSEKSGWNPSDPYKFHDALDVHRLWAGLKSEVKNPQIRIYESYAELKKAAEGDMSNPESSGDTELKGLCRLVEKYRHRLPGLIQQIIKNSTGPTQADIQLVTAHRAKGLEWPHVKLANDFTPLLIEKEGRLRLATPQLNGLGDAHIEEFNLLYVAITRSLERLEPHQELQKLLCSPLLNPNLPKPNLARYPSQNSQAQKTYDNELTEEKKSRKRQEWAEQIPFF